MDFHRINVPRSNDSGREFASLDLDLLMGDCAEQITSIDWINLRAGQIYGSCFHTREILYLACIQGKAALDVFDLRAQTPYHHTSQPFDSSQDIYCIPPFHAFRVQADSEKECVLIVLRAMRPPSDDLAIQYEFAKDSVDSVEAKEAGYHGK